VTSYGQWPRDALERHVEQLTARRDWCQRYHKGCDCSRIYWNHALNAREFLRVPQPPSPTPAIRIE
jgi:hypothetical protein